jgi:hypothetical protein
LGYGIVVGRLEGIGEQAVATIKALRQQLGRGSGLPLHLAAVEKISQSVCVCLFTMVLHFAIYYIKAFKDSKGCNRSAQ